MNKSLSITGAFALILLAIVLGGCCLRRPLPAGAKTIRLFNGRDLDGLYTWLVDSGRADPRGVFGVTNGMLRISGDGLGYLGTTTVHSNYHLTVEFRWGTTNSAWGDRIGKARDSGIFLHAVGPDGNSHDGGGAFRSAIECNLFEGACGDFLLIRGNGPDGTLIAPRVTVNAGPVRDRDGWPSWDPDGQEVTLTRWGRVNRRGKDPAWRDQFGFRGVREIEEAPGRWNRLEAECVGDRIRIWLNGTLVNEAHAVFPAAGAVLVQCEGSEIWFRRMDLEPIPR